MAREVITWCDRCLDRGERKQARERRIGVGTQWWAADLDDDCAAELLDPLAKLIANAGRPSEFLTKAEKKLPITTPDPDKFPAPDYKPTVREVSMHHVNLERRASGVRLGRKATGLQTPCLFCGILLAPSNSGHQRVHGFTRGSQAVGGHCPWCDGTFSQLGGHLIRGHLERLQRQEPIDLEWEILQAHVNKAPFDRLDDLRARAYNIEPLEVVIASLREYEASNA